MSRLLMKECICLRDNIKRCFDAKNVTVCPESDLFQIYISDGKEDKFYEFIYLNKDYPDLIEKIKLEYIHPTIFETETIKQPNTFSGAIYIKDDKFLYFNYRMYVYLKTKEEEEKKMRIAFKDDANDSKFLQHEAEEVLCLGPFSRLANTYFRSFLEDKINHIYVNEAKKTIVVKWKDGVITKVKLEEGDTWDLEAGVNAAAIKRFTKSHSSWKKFIENNTTVSVKKEKKNAKNKEKDTLK